MLFSMKVVLPADGGCFPRGLCLVGRKELLEKAPYPDASPSAEKRAYPNCNQFHHKTLTAPCLVGMALGFGLVSRRQPRQAQQRSLLSFLPFHEQSGHRGHRGDAKSSFRIAMEPLGTPAHGSSNQMVRLLLFLVVFGSLSIMSDTTPMHLKILAKCPPYLPSMDDPSNLRTPSLQRHKLALPPGAKIDSFSALAPLLAARLHSLVRQCLREGSLRCRGGRHTIAPKHSNLEEALRLDGHLEVQLGCEQRPAAAAARTDGSAAGSQHGGRRGGDHGGGAMGTFSSVPEGMGGYTAASPELAGAAQTGGARPPCTLERHGGMMP